MLSEEAADRREDFLTVDGLVVSSDDTEDRVLMHEAVLPICWPRYRLPVWTGRPSRSVGAVTREEED